MSEVGGVPARKSPYDKLRVVVVVVLVVLVVEVLVVVEVVASWLWRRQRR